MTWRLLLWGALAALPTAAAAQGDCYPGKRSGATRDYTITARRRTAAPTACPLPRPRVAITRPSQTFVDANRIRPIREDGTRADFAESPHRPNRHQFDLTAGHPVTNKVSAYFGAGYARVQPQFHLNYTNSMGDRDRRRAIADLDQVVIFGGGTWQPFPRLSSSGEVYVSQDDAITARLLIRVAF